MEAKTKEVQDYFKNRIITGDYTVVKYESSYMQIDIDGCTFCLWVASGVEYFKTWESLGRHFMTIPPFSKEEQDQAWLAVIKYIASNSEQIRKDRITALEKELNALKGI